MVLKYLTNLLRNPISIMRKHRIYNAYQHLNLFFEMTEIAELLRLITSMK